MEKPQLKYGDVRSWLMTSPQELGNGNFSSKRGEQGEGARVKNKRTIFTKSDGFCAFISNGKLMFQS